NVTAGQNREAREIRSDPEGMVAAAPASTGRRERRPMLTEPRSAALPAQETQPEATYSSNYNFFKNYTKSDRTATGGR
ncbi:hypothetical protein AAHH80_41045, partial [Burkholderia pseudomallei]